MPGAMQAARLALRLAPRIARLAAVAGTQWVAFGIARKRALRAFVRGALEAGMPEDLAREVARDYPDLTGYFGGGRISRPDRACGAEPR